MVTAWLQRWKPKLQLWILISCIGHYHYITLIITAAPHTTRTELIITASSIWHNLIIIVPWYYHPEWLQRLLLLSTQCNHGNTCDTINTDQSQSFSLSSPWWIVPGCSVCLTRLSAVPQSNASSNYTYPISRNRTRTIFPVHRNTYEDSRHYWTTPYMSKNSDSHRVLTTLTRLDVERELSSLNLLWKPFSSASAIIVTTSLTVVSVYGTPYSH